MHDWSYPLTSYFTTLFAAGIGTPELTEKLDRGFVVEPWRWVVDAPCLSWKMRGDCVYPWRSYSN